MRDGLVVPLPMLLLAVATICSTPRQASVSFGRSRMSTAAISARGANARERSGVARERPHLDAGVEELAA